MKNEWWLALVLVVLVAGCFGPFSRDEPKVDLSGDQIVGKIKDVDDAERFVRDFRGRIAVAVAMAREACAVYELSRGRPKAECMELDAAVPLLLEIEQAVLAGIAEWRFLGENQGARDQFVLLFLRQWRTFLDLQTKVRALGALHPKTVREGRVEVTEGP